jgi:hypothetical protein
MASTIIPRGNIALAGVYKITLSPASVANATSAEQTFTVPGLILGDQVSVSKPTTQAGLGIVNSRVSAANTLAITFLNTTAATITPTASEAYIVELNRPEDPNNLPSVVTA